MLRALIVTVFVFAGLVAGAFSHGGAQTMTPAPVTETAMSIGDGNIGHPDCQIESNQGCPLQCGVIQAVRHPTFGPARAVGVALVAETFDDICAARILRPPISHA